MKFAIDVVYVDRKHRVRKVVPGMGAWKLSFCLPAHSVVELPVGVIEATQTRKGDQLEFVEAEGGTGGSACPAFSSDGQAEPPVPPRMLLVGLALLLGACAPHRVAVARPPSAMDRQIVNAVDAGDGDYETKALRARVDANPLDLTARLELAKRYRKLGFPEIAIEHVRLACERAPESEEAHIALAKMLRDAGRPADGAVALGEFTAKRAASAQVWAWLGLLRDDAGDWKAGETAHRKALALAPDHDDLHNNLGYCLLKQGREREAAEEFRAALRLNPHSVVARNNLGTSLTASPAEAVTHLQSVTDAASAHNNLAVAYIEAGKYAEARKEIETALGYNRQHSEALSNLLLLSELDGHAAEVKAPVRVEGRWARVVAAWRRLRGDGVPDGRKSNESGSSVASR
jgi:tetratricopeptide (TPR) repeat protein